MNNEQQQQLSKTLNDKNTTKRKLARKLIQQIISLYDSIIQKIQHNIGLLWEEYISQQLYTLAKKRVQFDLINDLSQLENWFDNIAQTIKDQFNNLSQNLMNNFDKIIKSQFIIIDQQLSSPMKFTQAQQLKANQQKQEENNDQKKQTSSLYETCTQSSKQEEKGAHQIKKLCIICENHLSQAFGYCSKHQISHKYGIVPQIKYSTTNEQNYDKKNHYPIKQLNQQNYFSPNKKYSNQKQKRKRKLLQSEQSEQKEDSQQGGFYDVFFGLLQAFQI